MIWGIKTPDYVLQSDFHMRSGNGDPIVLLAGSFVRPLDLRWVPPHIKDDERNRYFNKDTQIYCYTSFGIIPIYLADIRQV